MPIFLTSATKRGSERRVPGASVRGAKQAAF